MNPTDLDEGLPPEMCRPENNPPVDLVDIDASTPTHVVDQARGVCWGCPVLVECRQYALRNDVWGVAAGMTRAERQAWARKHGANVTALDLVDVTPASQLSATVLDSIPTTDTGLDPRLIEVVLRMTRDGVPAEDIVTALSHTGLTHPTVNYIRRTYAKGASRVEV